MKLNLLHRLLIFTAVAGIIASFAVTSLKMNPVVARIVATSQMRPAMGHNNADFIKMNYAWRLISPDWIKQGNLSWMIRHWLKVEQTARLTVITVLWLAGCYDLIRGHFRNLQKP